MKFLIPLVFASICYFGSAAQAEDLCAVDFTWGGPKIGRVLYPQKYQVFQRDHNNRGQISVSVSLEEKADCIQARLVSGFFRKELTPWKPLVSTLGKIEADAGGWYQLQIRGVKNGRAGPVAVVDYVGIGEVIVVAGQSNAAFFGQERLRTDTQKVTFFDGKNWSLCQDPSWPVDGGGNRENQSGRGGSPWCLLGDTIVDSWAVPVAFVPVAVGGTSIKSWLEDTEFFNRLVMRIQTLGPGGVRAIFWHQGESDAQVKSPFHEYGSLLESLIAASRKKSGYQVPWMVAEVGFPGSGYKNEICSKRSDCENFIEACSQAVKNGQKSVLNSEKLIFPGASTDSLLGQEYRSQDGIHFNGRGLRAHADQWMLALTRAFTKAGSNQ